MKARFAKVLYVVMSVLMLGALMAGIAGCSGNNTSTTATSAAPADNAVILTVIKGEQSSTYTMTSLKGLPVLEGWAGQMSSTGTITGPDQYKGVAFNELLNAVGGITEENAVRVSAKDGYAMTLSYNQIMNGSGFPILDSTTGKEVASENTPIVFIVYEMNGTALDDTIGPLRLGIMTSDSQVTDGHWWIKWASKIEIISTVKPWIVSLEGAITEAMDQATFESGAAIGCHGVSYTDADGNVWDGIPLWYLLGRVDDATDTHKGDAFSDAAADAGYEVQLSAADGYSVSFTSEETRRNDGMIVAYKMNDEPLEEKNWPLKLVGANLTKKQMVGGIVTIKLVFAGAAATTTPAADAGPVVLTVIKGDQTVTYTLAQLQALTPLSGHAGTKNKAGVISGPDAYTGVAVTVLLEAVGGIPEGGSVVFTASDGYAKTLTYDAITNATFTTYDSTGTAVDPDKTPTVFLAYEKAGQPLDEATGPVQLAVMTCEGQVTDGSNFVKMVVTIEVKEAAQ